MARPKLGVAPGPLEGSEESPLMSRTGELPNSTSQNGARCGARVR